MATEWIRRASSVLARRPSTFELFANNQKLDVRAHQRTYEGAYIRSSIGALSFSILILKLFSVEFLPVGTVYTVYGSLLFVIGVYRSSQVEMYYSNAQDKTYFHTSGNIIILLSIISLLSYISLIVLILRM